MSGEANQAISSPNTQLMPVSACVSDDDHLTIGGLDTVELAEEFGTPLWVLDYDTIAAGARACQAGLAQYPDASVLYAGKAFVCLAMVKMIDRLAMGLDVVSEGELHTALTAGFPADRIYLHGNNKSDAELERAVEVDSLTVVVDGFFELDRLIGIARQRGRQVRALVRVTPGVEPDTHEYIKTGQMDSKFGISLDQIQQFVRQCRQNEESIRFEGLHAHIGSQSHDVKPYLEIVDILADLARVVLRDESTRIEAVDLGGGLGIAYTEEDRPLGLREWSQALSERVMQAFPQRGLELPRLLLEPGRSIVGPAGITLYRAGNIKDMPDGTRYVSLDGGMADNPRPATYKARYTARIASRMSAVGGEVPTWLVGRYCETGDIIIKDAAIPADTGDLVAVFGTGAYNYSMSSNYNRTGRPACVLVGEGVADVIVRRETLDDLLRQDTIPQWLDG